MLKKPNVVVSFSPAKVQFTDREGSIVCEDPTKYKRRNTIVKIWCIDEMYVLFKDKS
jgi:hypothetical protein